MSRSPRVEPLKAYERCVRVQSETHRSLKAYASLRDRPYQEVADDLLRQALESNGFSTLGLTAAAG